MQSYETAFKECDQTVAQVLLTHSDLADRKRYLRVRNTILALFRFNAIPILNENDTVAVDELRFGDNDTLAALVANLVEAELLIILTDQTGLFDADPSIHDSAQLISSASVNDTLLDEVAGESTSGLGRGGMYTKVKAARIAARSGAATVIVSGNIENVVEHVIAGQELGTFLIPDIAPLAARKQWLAGQLQIKGQLVLDDGAIKSLTLDGKSLLAAGIKSVNGQFKRGDLVSCISAQTQEVARGLVNYNAADAAKIAGKNSTEFEHLLGYADDIALIHRDNMVIL